MKRAIRPFTPVIAHWEDAYAQTERQHESTEAALRAYAPSVRHTTAFFMGYAKKDGRTALVLAWDDDRDIDSQEVGGMSYIPIGMLLGIEVLRRRKRAPKGRKITPKRRKR